MSNTAIGGLVGRNGYLLAGRGTQRASGWAAAIHLVHDERSEMLVYQFESGKLQPITLNLLTPSRGGLRVALESKNAS